MPWRRSVTSGGYKRRRGAGRFIPLAFRRWLLAAALTGRGQDEV